MLIPIRAEMELRRPALVNRWLIGINVAIFLVLDVLGGGWGQSVKEPFLLHAEWPRLYQYFSYMFLHGSWLHLAGNMLFLWIFGNAVNVRLGELTYLVFYLAGGVAAGVVFTAFASNPILGASGAIAAVTTAFLVLFPRVQITMLLVFYLITTFQVPALVLIVFKIILWDNIIAPGLAQDMMASNVAYSAHLGGYAFGFVVAILLLLVRALPRHHFDLLALIDRWQRRTGLQPSALTPRGRTVRARPVNVAEVESRPLGDFQLTPAERKREEVLDHLERRDYVAAAYHYGDLMRLDASMVLPRTQQLEIANHFKQAGKYGDAAAAYDAYLEAYPGAPDGAQVRLLLGLIYARYLDNPAAAAQQLRDALDGLTVSGQRQLAAQELAELEQRLGGS